MPDKPQNHEPHAEGPLPAPLAHRAPYDPPALERLGPWRLVTLQGSIGIFPGPFGDAEGFLDAARDIATWEMVQDILDRR